MNTSKIISNISYNTPEFFEDRIKDLESRGVIEWCYWIKHEADDDETKPHIHLVLQPSKRLNTDDLRTYLNQYDPDHPAKPLTVTKKWFFTGSHLDDWLLYAVHDRAYLASKGQRRRITYDYTDIKATDYDALRADIAAIDRRKFDRVAKIVEAAEGGIPFEALASTGIVPLAQYNACRSLYMDVLRHKSENTTGRMNPHEEVYDEETGEVCAQVEGFTPAPDIVFDGKENEHGKI